MGLTSASNAVEVRMAMSRVINQTPDAIAFLSSVVTGELPYDPMRFQFALSTLFALNAIYTRWITDHLGPEFATPQAPRGLPGTLYLDE